MTQLSNVLRSSLQTGKQELITIEKEIQIVRDYLEIEKARYEERLIVELEIDPASMSSKIPPLILQTIVENCIKHGIAKLPKGGTIKVKTKKAEDHLKIDIINDGQFDPSKKSDSSLGLENTRNRLDLSFGKSAWLTIGNLNEFKVRTQIYLPIKNTI